MKLIEMPQWRRFTAATMLGCVPGISGHEHSQSRAGWMRLCELLTKRSSCSALKDQFSLALAHVFASSAQEARRDVPAVKAHAEAAMRIARAEDFRLMGAWAAPLEGWAAVQEGHHQEGMQCIEAALAEARSNGSNSFIPYSLGLYAECCLIADERKRPHRCRGGVGNSIPNR